MLENSIIDYWCSYHENFLMIGVFLVDCIIVFKHLLLLAANTHDSILPIESRSL